MVSVVRLTSVHLITKFCYLASTAAGIGFGKSVAKMELVHECYCCLMFR
jgi:hypothetical protein